MKRIFLLILMCLFLSGCKEDTMKIWKTLDNIGDNAIFALRHRYTDEERYYRIKRISKEEFKPLRTE